MNTIKVKKLLFCLLALLSINQGLCQSSSTIELTPIRKGYYLLAKQNEFDNFIALLNNGDTFSGDTIELAIDVIGDNVSTGNRTFSGTFLGGNHKISNLSKPFVSELIGSINQFTIDATCRISGTIDVSSFCIRNHGELRGCNNYSQITGTASGESYMHIGGICAVSYGTIINCNNYGNVTATLNGYNKGIVRCGGVTSFQQGKNVIACGNYGTIKASAYYSALCGGVSADQQGGNLIGCINHGIVSSTVTGASSNGDASSSDIIHYTGGIVGQAQVGALIDRCKNYGAISNNTQYVGGIAGQVSNTDLYNLINYGRVESVQGKFYSCAAGITGYTHAVNTLRQIINCINKGDVISCSQYGIATAAGICPDIVNCSLANLYSSGSVSAQRIGGTGTQAFEIHDYEYDSQSVELNKISTIEQANAFIDSDEISKKRLLYWKQDTEGLGFMDFFYTYSEPSHGCADFYIFFDDANTIYNVTVIDKETGQQYASQGESPIRIALLQPSTTYSYEIYAIADGRSDKGEFTTLTPNIALNTQHVGYDNIRQFGIRKSYKKLVI